MKPNSVPAMTSNVSQDIRLSSHKSPARLFKEKPLNISTFNARSLRNKIDEIHNFVMSHCIHVLAISESWLGPSIPDSQIERPGFQTPFRRDRNENGGGVCLYISDQLSGKRRSDLEDPDVELLWVEIDIPSHPNCKLLVGSCYRPPSSKMDFYDKLETVLDTVAESNILLLGDCAKRETPCMVFWRFY